MTKDKRENRKLTEEEVKKTLNRKQLAALLECQFFGWRLKFIRRPLFQEPVPVIFNSESNQIGILEQDGHIKLDTDIEVRSHESESGRTDESPHAEKGVDATSWKEKRNVVAPVPDNLAELLNRNQMDALHQIEKFGWQLQFVRRPSFREPVPVIYSPNGENFATLERDGRINMTPDLNVRKGAAVEQADSVPFETSEKNKAS